jgi:hypothetical protein
MSPSATKLCRLCEISRADIRNHPTSDKLVLRSRRSIDEQAQYMSENFPNGDPSTGIKGICPLNDSSFFHIGENFILDAMHDIPEGVSQFCLKLCLREWIIHKKEYGLSADFINERIRSFHYGRYDSENKPSPKFTDANLREIGNYSTKQRAGQNLCLLRNFPLMFADKIPDNDHHFRFLPLFLSISYTIVSPKVTEAHCNILKVMILEFFE